VKIAEARDLEDEVQRLKADNAELQTRVSELASMEAAKKKAETRAEQLEEKVRLMDHALNASLPWDRWTLQLKSELSRRRMS
jgi:predicted RNase H-like nuclease (RuvC/YqgF family)